ncbi:MAG: CRTAC1 family protein [Sedimentisphaerales bacterium]|nr:CRTAC1 family protein [Sedimentisphaerales bacterium]
MGGASGQGQRWIVGVLVWSLVCASTGAAITLTDVTAVTGITFQHTDGSSGQRYIVESVAAGLALFDYDNDGDIDIYFLNGAPLRGTVADETFTNKLYRNEGGWRFTDVTEQARVGDTGCGLGVTVGDYDNDGDLDLYLNNYGPNVLYRNNDDQTFTDVTAQAGVGNGYQVGATTHFLDMDTDGDLDLFVGNYLDFTYENHRVRTANGIPKYAGPLDFPAVPNTLYRNNGDGTFTDVSAASGIAAHKGWAMGGVCADYDNDGDTDIYVANDEYANFLFQNDGTGQFEETGLLLGLAYDLHGDDQGSMGIDCGDHDNDGWLDFYQTSYAEELTALYRNVEGRLFEDVTMATGAGASTLPVVTWGSGLQVKRRSRGAAFDDMDNDGDVDVVILNARREPTLLRNDTSPSGHWLQVCLRGTKANRDGIGAHVKVTAAGRTQIAEVHSGRAYQSHYGLRLHFGLGQATQIDRVEVRWLGGATDVSKNLPADQIVTLTEGASGF